MSKSGESIGDGAALQNALHGPDTPKRRKTARTALACSHCRRRKIRCSGQWPACSACINRGQECVYPGNLPRPELGTASDGTPVDVHGAGGSNNTTIPHGRAKPPRDLRRAAIAHFRTHYATTLLNLFPPQQLIDDDAGDDFPLPLLLCIIVLASRSIQSSAQGEIASRNLTEYYEDAARRELSLCYEEPSLVVIQSCLILCVYEVGEGAEHRGWLRLAHAAKLAQLLQLHKQDTDLGLMDWGQSRVSRSATVDECRRRTFWCCFNLERLLANGRERLVTFVLEDITTQFPQSEEDFIFGRQVHTCKLRCPLPGLEPRCDHSHAMDSITTHTIRVIDILSKVVSWNGRGGRHVDARCPWLPDMPFTVLDSSLNRWAASVPRHLKHTRQNTSAVIAIGQGRPWAMMWMVYYQARLFLHREYLPFTPKKGYDPLQGPCDGPPLHFHDNAVAAEFWRRSALAMIESANAISDLYQLMRSRDLSASAYPTPGFGLLAAASIHVQLSLFDWEAAQPVMAHKSAREYLKQDMEGLNDLGQRWSLAVHWIRQVSLYYKLNFLTKRSWSGRSGHFTPTTMRVQEIKDGIMNYVRQISPGDRAARDVHLKPRFDFDGWLSVLETSTGEDEDMLPSAATEGNGEDEPQDQAESGPMVAPDGGGDVYEEPALGDIHMGGFHTLDGLAAITLPDADIEWMFGHWNQ
ncbi:uncharacterized protein B0I36DRAFT_366253 [Microdochium trichocladiopsis]|uniref:Zn(2)-C6 fungal-type domain-containing protein n=1 Tax=Microdochium trichocladiopsis TaxID=1682393 RepID=A0A9P9BN92_9PEZI|nr:uncharacterized protein B0I36DRAFT_366253 [Microdochium trichocladiopsis]KAH7026726.1 hypothetical protein B0I36DRAFT_366253 [Microdochium trichocladiopsis]